MTLTFAARAAPTSQSDGGDDRSVLITLKSSGSKHIVSQGLVIRRSVRTCFRRRYACWRHPANCFGFSHRISSADLLFLWQRRDHVDRGADLGDRGEMKDM